MVGKGWLLVVVVVFLGMGMMRRRKRRDGWVVLGIVKGERGG